MRLISCGTNSNEVVFKGWRKYMSRLNRIQNEIKQLEGGKFQNLCDEYLYRKMNWDNIVSLGSMAGTDKTTIGTPDTYTFSDWVER